MAFICPLVYSIRLKNENFKKKKTCFVIKKKADIRLSIISIVIHSYHLSHAVEVREGYLSIVRYVQLSNIFHLRNITSIWFPCHRLKKL